MTREADAKSRRAAGRRSVVTHRPRLLLADDDEDLRAYVSLVLQDQGYDVIEAKDGVELLDYLDFGDFGDGWRSPFDVVVADFHMPGLTGIEALEGLALAGEASRVVVISAYADEQTIRHAESMGAAAFVRKPVQLEALVQAVKKACQANDDLPETPLKFVG